MATLWQPAALRAHEDAVSRTYFLYFGLLGGMLLYNLLLYVLVRDSGYLLYVGVIACVGVGIAGQSGLGAQFVWRDVSLVA